MTQQQTLADRFRSLHQPGSPLILVNVWDAASARIIEAAGAAAIATTSAGVAWSLGAPDGDALGRDLAVDLVKRVVAAVSVPVTADIEAGFGATPDEVGETITAIIDAGAVGVNIEDALHDGAGPLRAVDDQCARLAAVKDAAERSGVALFINARVDTFLRGAGGVEETVARAAAYLNVGADGIFVPGVVDAETIAALTAAIPAPVNILVGPSAPAIPALGQLGVARASLGSAVAEAAYTVARRAAVEAFGPGTYETVRDALDYSTINALMSR